MQAQDLVNASTIQSQTQTQNMLAAYQQNLLANSLDQQQQYLSGQQQLDQSMQYMQAQDLVNASALQSQTQTQNMLTAYQQNLLANPLDQQQQYLSDQQQYMQAQDLVNASTLQSQTQSQDVLAAYLQQQQQQQQDLLAMYTSGGGVQQQFGQDQTFDAQTLYSQVNDSLSTQLQGLTQTNLSPTTDLSSALSGFMNNLSMSDNDCSTSQTGYGQDLVTANLDALNAMSDAVTLDNAFDTESSGIF